MLSIGWGPVHAGKKAKKRTKYSHFNEHTIISENMRNPVIYAHRFHVRTSALAFEQTCYVPTTFRRTYVKPSKIDLRL